MIYITGKGKNSKLPNLIKQNKHLLKCNFEKVCF